MKPPTNSLEQRVLTGMQTLLEKYQQLNQIADAMAQKQAQQQDIIQDLRTLDEVKLQIASIEQQTKPDRDEYRASQKTASPAVLDLTRRSTELLMTVKTKIDQLESHVRDAQGKLAPSIDQGVRASQMQRAYGR